MSNTNTLVATLLNICAKLTIAIGADSTDVVGVSKTTLILCMKFINRQELFQSVMVDSYVDWSLVPSNCAKTNLLGDSAVWLELMKFVDFGHMDTSELVLQKEYPPLWCIYNALRQNNILRVIHGGTVSDVKKNADESEKTTEGAILLVFDDVCKLCILNNIIGIQSKTITDQYLATKLKRSTFAISSSILSAFADERHSADVYLKTMRYLLEKIDVDHPKLHANILYYNQAHDKMKTVMAMKNTQNRYYT